MKRTFLLLLLLLVFISADSTAQRKDTSDYFAVSLYGGSYISQAPLYERNKYLNSIAAEFEYFKFKDLSFYVQGLYEFTGSDIRELFNVPYWRELTEIHNPDTYRLNTSFGGRYYLRNKNVNPFFQLGINHETNFIGDYSYTEVNTIFGDYIWYGKGYYFYRLSVNLGVGLNIKISHNFDFVLKYDLYKSIIKTEDEFTGFSLLGGVKYNLF